MGCLSDPTGRSTRLSADVRTARAPRPAAEQEMQSQREQSTWDLEVGSWELGFGIWDLVLSSPRPSSWFDPWLRPRAEDRLAEIVGEAVQITVVFLANVFRE